MELDRCKNCLGKELQPFKDEEYIDEFTNEKKLISGLKCPVCGCIHVIDEEGRLDFWEYITDHKEEDQYKAVGNYATDFNTKKNNDEMQQNIAEGGAR